MFTLSEPVPEAGGASMDDDTLPGVAADSTANAMSVDLPEAEGGGLPAKVSKKANVDPPIPSPSAAKEYGIDVPFEASKLPLDVAIYNSVRAAGPDEKMKKYLNAVLVIGGTSLISSMDHALRSR